MHGSIVQATQSLDELITPERPRLCNGLALNHLRETRSRSNGGDAAAGFVPHLFDPFSNEFDCELHDVATNRVLQAHLGISICEFADVARMLKVVE